MTFQIVIFLAILGTLLAGPTDRLIEDEDGDDNLEIKIICKDDNDGDSCYATGRANFGEVREGDILEGVLKEGGSEGRNAIISDKNKWPEGVVPYVFHEGFSHNDRKVIKKAMKTIEKVTCTKFQPYVKSKDEKERKVLIITPEEHGCRSTIGYGKRRERHYMNLNPHTCLRRIGIIQHEILHVLGLLHEQARPDRDEYVQIIWENIKENHTKNFDKGDPKRYTTFGLPYNFQSLMHYPPTAFTKNGEITIKPLDPTLDIKELGQRKSMTRLDIKKINLMYHCKEFL